MTDSARNLLRHITGLPRKAIVGCIMLYQHTLSPDHGPLRHIYPYGYCRHSPTCSEYGKRIITEKGAVIGGVLTIRRLLICHPWREPDAERIMEAMHRTHR